MSWNLVLITLCVFAMCYCIYKMADLYFKNMRNISKPEQKPIDDLFVGDVLIDSIIMKNPFSDFEYKYETVKEVRKNEDGDIYFLSYTSDINGNPILEQDKYKPEHTFGKHYYKSNWNMVNHIDIQQ